MDIRNWYFDLVKSNKIALSILAAEFGWPATILIAARLQLRLLTANPFRRINREKPPSIQERLTQRQMAPFVVLYLLLEETYPRARTMRVLSKLGTEIGVAFLQYNVPTIHAADYEGLSRRQKLSKLKKITRRFFNAKAELKLDAENNIHFTVNVCYFARYAQLLNVPELGPLFCASDKIYFQKHQPEIKFIRTVTLAENDKPCDFYFQWHGQNKIKQVEDDATMRTVF